MLLFALVFLVVWSVLTGIGFAIGLAACAMGFALVALGVVSSSIAVGLRARRASSGVKAFLLQCGILAGIPSGAVCALLLESVWHGINATRMTIAAYGALAGACSGLAVALFLDLIARRALATLGSNSAKPSLVPL